MQNWTWAAATCIGTSHLRASTRRQDAYACAVESTNNAFLAVVSDGAGSAKMGGQGASLTCRLLLNHARAHFKTEVSAPSEGKVIEWIEDVRLKLKDVASKRQLESRDFAATLILAISTAEETVIVHIGDGTAVIQDDSEADWFAISWPSQGEYASTTYFITDNPHPKVSFSRRVGSISGLALLTDGLERLALNMEKREAFQPFFGQMIKPLQGNLLSGRDHVLSRKLCEYLESDRINERTDDDKTLVLAVRK